MPKKTVAKKKHSRKPIQKKQKHTMSQSQSQTVHVHLHKNTHSQKTQSHVHKKTTSTPVSAAIPFVSPLPMYHPLNNNVPYSSFSSTYPINSFTNQAVPLVPQPVQHPVPQPHSTSAHASQHIPGTPQIGGVLHGTEHLLSASPLSSKTTPGSTGFRSPGTSGFRSAGSVDSEATLSAPSTRTQSRTSSSVASVKSSPKELIRTQSRTPTLDISFFGSPHILTQSQSPSPLVQPTSPTQTLTKSPAKDTSRTASNDDETKSIPPRQLNFSAQFSPSPTPAEKKNENLSYILMIMQRKSCRI